MTRAVRVSAAMVAILFAAGMTLRAQDPPKQEEKKSEAVDVSGAWDMTVETQQGPRTVGVTFKVDNEKLSGTIKGPQGDFEITGSLNAAALEFSGTVNTQNGAIEVRFTGTAEKDKLSGKVDYGTGTATWSAVRVKS